MNMPRITVSNAGKVLAAVILGLGTGVFAFLLWILLEHGAQ